METSIIREILEKSKREKSIIGIWTYGDDDGFWSGYVTDYNDNFVQIQHFTKYGKSDGVIIEKIENIETIDLEDDYAKCLQFLIDNHELLDREEPLEHNFPADENWQYSYLSAHLGKKDRMVRISVQDDIQYSGFVHQLDGNNVLMHLISKQGEDEGYSMFKLEDISSIRVNDIENRKRLLLYNWKQS